MADSTRIPHWWQNRYLHGALGIVAAIVAYYWVPAQPHPQAPKVAAMVMLMAVWWIFEVIPIPVTSLFPLVFLPFFGIADAKTVGAFYGRPIIYLFLGGFMLALGLQKSNLHKRIALQIVRLIGSKPKRLVLGIMIASGLLSMWISNTASVLVILPIALSILKEAGSRTTRKSTVANLGVCLALGLAYAADIGGMATIIGTPPNLVYAELFSQLFPQGPEMGFLSWMMMGLPITLLFMTFGWLLLTRVIFRLPQEALFGSKVVIRKQLRELGPIHRDEIMAGSVFLLAALLWMTGSDLGQEGGFHLRGWRSLLDLPMVTDAVVAIGAASLLFLIPSRDRKGENILQWDVAKEIPWGILLLFGGGFALAGGFEISGLSLIVGNWFEGLSTESPFWLVVSINTLITFLTELTSNTAMTNLVLPILAKASVVLQIDPRLIMIPATLSASCAFMMPVASPTQAIVFGSGYVSIKQMIRAGIWFNVLGILLVTFFFLILGPLVLGISLTEAPEWLM
jgi:sodium-dependent dicarboxylate transporter 2/3/5